MIHKKFLFSSFNQYLSIYFLKGTEFNIGIRDLVIGSELKLEEDGDNEYAVGWNQMKSGLGKGGLGSYIICSKR